jgi:hypothetical protein
MGFPYSFFNLIKSNIGQEASQTPNGSELLAVDMIGQAKAFRPPLE